MNILMTITGISTMAGAAYIGSLSLEVIADDFHSHTAKWSHVGADLIGFAGAACAFITGLYAVACAWLP